MNLKSILKKIRCIKEFIHFGNCTNCHNYISNAIRKYQQSVKKEIADLKQKLEDSQKLAHPEYVELQKLREFKRTILNLPQCGTSFTTMPENKYIILTAENGKLKDFRAAIKNLCFQYEAVDSPWTDEQIINKCENLIDACDECDVAERMRKLVYLASNGMMSYANYTYEAMEQVYYEQLDKQIEESKKKLQEENARSNETLEKIKKIFIEQGHCPWSNIGFDFECENCNDECMLPIIKQALEGESNV